jgi:hypothetical protein
MLHTTGRTTEELAELEARRPLLVAEYGRDSIRVGTLDRRIKRPRHHST